MKKLLLLAICFLAFGTAAAQDSGDKFYDLVVTVDGDSIRCRVMRIADSNYDIELADGNGGVRQLLVDKQNVKSFKGGFYHPSNFGSPSVEISDRDPQSGKFRGALNLGGTFLFDKPFGNNKGRFGFQLGVLPQYVFAADGGRNAFGLTFDYRIHKIEDSYTSSLQTYNHEYKNNVMFIAPTYTRLFKSGMYIDLAVGHMRTEIVASGSGYKAKYSEDGIGLKLTGGHAVRIANNLALDFRASLFGGLIISDSDNNLSNPSSASLSIGFIFGKY